MTAVAVVALFVLSVFALRTWLHRRRTGDAGWRGLSGRPFSAPWWAGTLFVVAIVTGGVAPVAALAGLPPFPGYSATGYVLLGLVLVLAGTVITVQSQVQLGDSWRIGVEEGERTELVTHGSFRWIRNPFFTGTCTFALGVLVLVPNVVAATGWVLLVAAVQLQVRAVEEPHLLRTHADVYREYAARTGRFLPGAGRRVEPVVEQPRGPARTTPTVRRTGGPSALLVTQLVVLGLHAVLALVLTVSRAGSPQAAVLPLALTLLWLGSLLAAFKRQWWWVVVLGLAVAATPVLHAGGTAPSLPQVLALVVLVWTLVASWRSMRDRSRG